MYIQNRRDSCKFKGCSPLQSCNGLISLKPAIAYFAYTNRSLRFPHLNERTESNSPKLACVANHRHSQAKQNIYNNLICDASIL